MDVGSFISAAFDYSFPKGLSGAHNVAVFSALAISLNVAIADIGEPGFPPLFAENSGNPFWKEEAPKAILKGLAQLIGDLIYPLSVHGLELMIIDALICGLAEWNPAETASKCIF
ncbi:MAG: hypothetical protein WCD81_00515 [Candidatus Bathyarchaeia archaeon]